MSVIGSMGPRSIGMRAPEETLTEKMARPMDGPDDEATPAAAVNRFVQNSDEMAASLRSQFRRRADVGDKIENPSEGFERVLEEDAIPRAMQIRAMAGEAGRSAEWLLQQARQRFSDPSDLVLVLRELLRRQDMPVATRQRLETMLAQVQSQAPAKRLKAGINCALKARLFGRRMALRAGLLRESYRSFLEGEDDPGSSYEDWIALYGYEHRSPVLDFIEAALLTDIDALDPSCSRREFGELLRRLGDLKCLRSADALFIQHLLSDALIREHNASEPDWLVFLLGLLRYPDDLDQLLQGPLGERMLLVSHRDRAALLHMIRLACLGLPLRLFADEEALIRVAEQFIRLGDAIEVHEAIERRNALHAAASSQDL